MARIYIIPITLAAQGGVGYPPCVACLRGTWYAVTDSRHSRRPESVAIAYLPRHHHLARTQSWCLRMFRTAPKRTWDELIQEAA